MTILDLLKKNYQPAIVEYITQHNDYCTCINSAVTDLITATSKLKNPPKLLKSGMLDKASRSALYDIVARYREQYVTTSLHRFEGERYIYLQASRAIQIPTRKGWYVCHYLKSVINFYSLIEHKPIIYILQNLELKQVNSSINILLENESKIADLQRELRTSQVYLSGTNLKYIEG